MPQSLSTVINALYKPPVTGRQVLALSRKSAESLPLLDNVAVISITAPDRNLAQLKDFEQVLRLSFADVDFSNKELSARAKQKIVDAPTEKDAEKVIHFVDDLPSTVHSLVIHCEGGFSRSCAVALFLHQTYGYRADVSSLQEYNPSLLELLKKTYTKKTTRNR